jgi:hypothetical protein
MPAPSSSSAPPTNLRTKAPDKTPDEQVASSQSSAPLVMGGIVTIAALCVVAALVFNKYKQSTRAGNYEEVVGTEMTPRQRTSSVDSQSNFAPLVPSSQRSQNS